MKLHTSTLRLPPISYIRNIATRWNRKSVDFVLTFFVLVQIVALFFIYFWSLPSYPIGWDVPYYIKQILLFESGYEPGLRQGFVFFMVALHKITHVDIVLLLRIITPVIITGTAFSMARLVSKVSPSPRSAFLWTFTFALWSTNYFSLSISTLDNAWSYMIGIFALGEIIVSQARRRRAIVFALLGILVGFTHLETFALLSFVFLLFLVLRFLQKRNIRQIWLSEKEVILAYLLMAVLTTYHWRSLLRSTVTVYSTTADTGLNAGIQYASSHGWDEIVRYLQTGISNASVGVVILVTILFMGYKYLRKGERGVTMLLAFTLASYGILLYSVVRGSIPIDRAMLLVPAPALFGYGLSLVVSPAVRYLPLAVSLLIFPTIFIYTKLPTAYASMVKRFPQSIRPPAYEAILNFNAFVYQQVPGSYVIVVDIPAAERAATAYYLLWKNWFDATSPSLGYGTPHCTYLGTIENAIQKVPTVRKDNPEYNSTSEFGVDCLRNIRSDARIFVLSDFNPVTIQSISKKIKLLEVAPRVFEALPTVARD